MPLYLCDVVGTGTDADPLRPPTDEPGSGWVCLAPPGSLMGKGILFLPTHAVSPRLVQLADLADELVSGPVRTRLQNALSLTLTQTRFAAILAELLTVHGRLDGTRWGLLRPSVARQRFEIWLGALGLIWSAPAPPTPATQTFTETWPTNGTTLSSGQDQVWTETTGDLEVAAGVLRAVATTLQINHARCESVLDTSNQRHEASFTLVDGSTVVNAVRPSVRCSDSNNEYRVDATRRSGGAGYIRRGEKRVASVNTTIVTNSASDPGASGTISVTIDGSTMSIVIGAYSNNGTDGTPELLTNLKGAVHVLAVSAVGDATLDTHTIADVAAAATWPGWMSSRGGWQ